MQNPYWAARNVVEYIQDNYYYPSPPKRKPATVDYDRQHYDANPGNLKIELSARPYDKTQIIACSGTSVMVAGAMRHLGIPARWLGTGTQQGPEDVGHQRATGCWTRTRRHPAPTGTATRRSGWAATTAGSASTRRRPNPSSTTTIRRRRSSPSGVT